MEAKDTIINEETYNKLEHSGFKPYFSDTKKLITGRIEEIKNQQAEISFKAGMKEVIDWINHNSKLYQGETYYSEEEWQAKLKEWNIE